MNEKNGALNLYGDPAFQNKVSNQAVECTEIAYDLQAANGNVGGQLTIIPAPGSPDGLVGWPTSLGPARGNYHSVYVNGDLIFDPRYDANGPIPRSHWETLVNQLNPGCQIDFDNILPTQPS